MQRIDSYKREIEEHKKLINGKIKWESMMAEREVLQTLNPKEILINAKLNLTLKASSSPNSRLMRGRSKNRNSLPPDLNYNTISPIRMKGIE